MTEITRDEVLEDFNKLLSDLPDVVFRSAVHHALCHVFRLYDFEQPDGSIDVYVVEELEKAAKGH